MRIKLGVFRILLTASLTSSVPLLTSCGSLSPIAGLSTTPSQRYDGRTGGESTVLRLRVLLRRH